MSKDNPARKTFEPMLSPYVDGELSPADRQAVEQHLAACKESAMQVADLRATGGLLRVAMDMQADDIDWKDFTQNVMAKVGPEKLPLFERLKLFFSETFTYQRPVMVTSLATAMVVALVAVPLALRNGAGPGYGNLKPQIQSVSVEKNATVKPVVMETAEGDAIIWMVETPETAPGVDAAKDKKGEGESHEELDIDLQQRENAGNPKKGPL
ncbi:MAG: zf-HC2 domain-containing protein [Myxococcaceae bacterium]|nr:zf-HC2 domain-containing protein [Myxococcaceae bacterium]